MKLAFLDRLKAGMILAEDARLPDDSLLFTRGTVLNPENIEAIKRHGISSIHISNLWKFDMNEPEYRIPIAPKFEIPQQEALIATELKKEAVESIEHVFQQVSLGQENITPTQVVQTIEIVVEQFVEALMKDQRALVNITDLKSHDEYTYHHSLSVAVLAVAIGQQLDFDRQRLNDLGKSAILHDIGKMAVPAEIIRKPDKLDNREFDVMRSHPIAGYRYLRNGGVDLSTEILSGILLHHERVDGNGYPYRIKMGSIPLFARIISVADVYDALTSHRPYRVPNPPSEALEYVMGGAGTMFDFDIVHAFLKKIVLYPLGTPVQLSDGRIAIVIENDNALRPVVRIVDTSEIVDLQRDFTTVDVTIEHIFTDDEFVFQ